MSIANNIFNFIRRSLRVKVTLGVILPLIVILGIFTGIQYRRQKAIILNNLSLLASHSGKVIEDNLRQQMLRTDFDSMQRLLDSIGESQSFQSVYLLNTSGEIIFSPKGESVGAQLDNSQPDCQACHRLPNDDKPSSVVVTTAEGNRVFRSMNPIENSQECAQCHQDSGEVIGLLLTDISTAPFEASLNADLRENLMWAGLTILIAALVTNLSLSHFVLFRLEAFAAAIKELGRGQTPPQLPVSQGDELGQLARTFNLMAHQINARDQENKDLSEDLRRQNELRGELLRRLITAQEDERKRVARELHDELGQALSGLALQAEAVQRFIHVDRRRAEGQLKKTRELVTATTDKMYDLILALRPSALDDLGLAAALRAHAERCLSGTGIELSIDTSGLNGRLPPETETALYRVFQEALSNILRHSDATKVEIRLGRQNGEFEGQIHDDGRGFDPQSIQLNGDHPRGLGLLGMTERIDQLGGQINIHSQPGKGASIDIRIPLGEHVT